LLPAVNETLFSRTAKAPMRSSSACDVVVVDAVVIEVPLFAPLAVLSSRPDPETKPENSSALIALGATCPENVTVIASPLTSAVPTVAEKMTARALPELEFVTSASLVYEFPRLSAQDTVTFDESIASSTMTVLPAATPAAGTVTAIVVLLLVPSELVPITLTNAGAADAGAAVTDIAIAKTSAMPTRELVRADAGIDPCMTGRPSAKLIPLFAPLNY